MNNKFAYPRLDNYYSDWHQLTFSLEPNGGYAGVYSFQENQLGEVSAQIIAINLASLSDWEKGIIEQGWIGNFVNMLIRVWMHEFLHLIGLTDNAICIISELNFPVDCNNQ